MLPDHVRLGFEPFHPLFLRPLENDGEVSVQVLVPFFSWVVPFATAWMELESIMLSEISQAVRDKYHMISPLTGT